MTYQKYKNLLASRAWHWHRCNPHIEFEDLLGEAGLAFCICQTKFDPERGTKFSTFLHHCVNNALHLYVMRNVSRFADEVDLLPDRDPSSEALLQFKQWASGLSAEAQFICRCIWETPAELVEMAMGSSNPKNTRRILAKYLRERGWKWRSIFNAFTEIKEGLKT